VHQKSFGGENACKWVDDKSLNGWTRRQSGVTKAPTIGEKNHLGECDCLFIGSPTQRQKQHPKEEWWNYLVTCSGDLITSIIAITIITQDAEMSELGETSPFVTNINKVSGNARRMSTCELTID
jgi:hypothetical protein